MAEIRSTLDMVMERARRMAERAADVPPEQHLEEKGMRMVADFLAGGQTGLPELLYKEDPASQMSIRKGMSSALIRNVVLPRDDQMLHNSSRVLQIIRELGGGDGEINSICAELSQILEQYAGHKDQLKQQLTDNIRTQLAQRLQAQTGEAVDMKAIDPTMHPQYQKEWERARGDLNEQYREALEQRKDILRGRFS